MLRIVLHLGYSACLVSFCHSLAYCAMNRRRVSCCAADSQNLCYERLEFLLLFSFSSKYELFLQFLLSKTEREFLRHSVIPCFCVLFLSVSLSLSLFACLFVLRRCLSLIPLTLERISYTCSVKMHRPFGVDR